MLCTSMASVRFSGNLLDGVLKMTNCVSAALRESSLLLQNSLISIYNYLQQVVESHDQDILITASDAVVSSAN